MDKPIEMIQTRLRKAIDRSGLTQQEVANKTKIPKASISQYLSGYAKPKNDRIYLLANALDVNEAWLLGFDVPMKKGDANESEILCTYNALNEDGQKRLLEYAKDLSEMMKYKK